jgi:hypothetical protein
MCTLEGFQNEISDVIRNITEGELQQVYQNNLHWCQMCFVADGHPFDSFLKTQVR